MERKKSMRFELEHTTESDWLNSVVVLDVMASWELESDGSTLNVSRTVKKEEKKC